MDLLLGISLLFLTFVTESLGAYCRTSSNYLYSSNQYCPYGCCAYTGYVCCASGLGTSIVWIITSCVGVVITIIVIIVVVCCCRRRRGAPGTIVHSPQMQPMVISTTGVQSSYMQPGAVYHQGQPGTMYPQQATPGYPQQPIPGYPQQPTPGYPQQPIPEYPQQPTPGYPQQPTPGYPQQPTPGYPQQQQDLKTTPEYNPNSSSAPPTYESLNPDTMMGYSNTSYDNSKE